MRYEEIRGLVVARKGRKELKREIDALEVPPLVKAGLHLLNGDLEGCHEIAQAHETPDGNYWHAILHRREGDLSNSQYWYRRVGEHPVRKRMRELHPDWSERDEHPDEMRLLLEWVEHGKLRQ